MRFSNASLIAAAASASADTIQVAVGQNGLTFTPSDIKATVGQSVEFSFFPKNHSVTQSSFKDPCHPLEGGFFSTFMPTTAQSSTTYTILVNDTKPIWLYCGQTTGKHCQNGMVASINAPATGNTLEAFVSLAKNATNSTSPSNGLLSGGILKVNSNSNSSSSTSGSGNVVEKTVTATVTSLVTSAGSSYSTTYGTTYTTPVSDAGTATTDSGAGASATGAGSNSGASSTSSAAKSTGTNAANGLVVNGGIAGAALVFALGML